MKAIELYNNTTLILKSRVLADFGPPFDEQHTIHPVSVGHRFQPETFPKKYTDKCGVIDKFRGNLGESEEGTSAVKRFTDSEHNYYTTPSCLSVRVRVKKRLFY
jgi:hypothetical protein